MQYPLGINSSLCTYIDYVFLFRNNIVQDRKRLYNNYGYMFKSFEQFCLIMNKYTENYGCVVICQGSKSNNILDQVFWYKAKDNGSFKICDENLCNEFYCKISDEDRNFQGDSELRSESYNNTENSKTLEKTPEKSRSFLDIFKWF